jgi:hypothetical protein
MRRELVVCNENCFASPKLQKLATTAYRAHLRARECAAKSVENMVRAGQALRKLRDLSDDTEWNAFLENNFDGSERTVQRYMYLAKHWSLLQAVAPPEALTSQRKAMQLLRTLLYGEGATAEAAGPRRKPRATAAIELKPAAARSDATSAHVNAADDDGRNAVTRMCDHVMRVLAELTRDLSELAPPHYLVSYALGAISRAQRQCAEMEGALLGAESVAGENSERGMHESADETPPASQASSLSEPDDNW